MLKHIAKRLHVSDAQVYGVATFYAQFYLARQGRHSVRCCDGTACHVRGAPKVIQALEQDLGIAAGETTPDYRLTLEVVYCLGLVALRRGGYRRPGGGTIGARQGRAVGSSVGLSARVVFARSGYSGKRAGGWSDAGRVGYHREHAHNRLTIRVADNGRGMDAQTVQRVIDPFFTTRSTRNVGLGLPLLRAAAQRCNGDLTVTSQLGVGTTVLAEFQRDHIDRAPLGDMPSTLWGVLLSDRACDLRYVHEVDGRVFELDTRAMREILGDVPLTHPDVRVWLQRIWIRNKLC